MTSDNSIENSGSVFSKDDIVKLGIIALIFLAFNAGYYALSYPESRIQFDSPSYIEPAEMLVNEFKYESVLRLPGYPLLIAGAMAITNNYVAAVIVIQIGLTLCAGVFAVMIGNYYLQKISWPLFLLVLFNSAVMPYNHTILPDVLFMVLFLGYLLFLIKTVKDKSLWNALWCGVFAGLMTLTRGNGYYLSLLTPLLIMVCYIGEFKNIGFKKVAIKPVIFLIVFAAVISPWLAFNYKTKGTLSVNTSEYMDQSVIQVLVGVDRLGKGATFFEAFDSVREKAAEIKASETGEYVDPKTIDGDYLVSHGREIFFMHPKKDNAKAILIATGLFYFDPGYKPIANQLKIECLHLDNSVFGGRWTVGRFFKTLFSSSSLPLILDVGLIGFIVLLRILAVVGFFACFKGKDWQLLMFAGVTVLYFTVTTGLVAYARYRVAIEPVLLILAVMGATYCKDTWQKTRAIDAKFKHANNTDINA